LTQLDNTAEFVAAAILRVGQDELRVVLYGHGSRLPPGPPCDCETKHKMPDSRIFSTACCGAAYYASHKCLSGRRIRAFRGHGAQI
jgi:hypothetical protein